MTVRERRALVARLEDEAKASPRAYRIRLALLAGLGFAVLGGAVLLALGMSVGLVLVLLAISPILLLKLAKVIWIPIAFGWMVLRALWVRFEPPAGHRLAPGEAPRLQDEVERLRVAAGAPKLAGIVIDDELNAAAASVPRALGLLGHRHYLVLGLPMMQLLDREQFASVVAHEFGHFGGGHGRFTGWIYRVRSSWYRLLDALSGRGSWTGRVFSRFFDWYAPYFDAYSFVLARGNEYQADATAARIAGAEVAGQALVRVNVGAARLQQDFWPGVLEANRGRPEPPALLYRDMAASLRQAHADDGARIALQLAASPGIEDTHPTLAQRLEALGVAPAEPPPPQESAADALLGTLLSELEQQFSAQWRERVDQGWRERHRQHAADVERLGELELADTRTPEEVVEHARLVELLHPEVDALALYRRAATVAPDHPFLQYRIGTLLLARDDRDGIAHLRRVIALDPASEGDVLLELAAFHSRVGNDEALEVVEVQLARLRSRMEASSRARAAVSRGDRFEPHGLSADALDAVRDALDSTGCVAKAWIARKVLADDPHGTPHYAVLVALRGFSWSQDSALQKVVDALELPGSFIVFTAPNQRAIARRVRKAAGSPDFVR